MFTENLRLAEKQKSKSKKHEKVPPNIVKNKKKQPQEEPKKNISEDRVNKDLEKLIAFQVRAAKRKQKPKKIRSMDDDSHNTAKQSIYAFIFILIL